MEIAIKSSTIIVLLAVFINLTTIPSIVYGKSTHLPATGFSDNVNTSIEFLINSDRHPADPKDFPYTAIIEYERNEDIKQCLGAIIHKNWIITAGCSRIWFEPNRFIAIVGLGLKADENGKRYKVANIKLHPDFPGDNYFNHFALIKTSKSIRMNRMVQPIRLNRKAIANETPGVIARWQVVSRQFSLNGISG